MTQINSFHHRMPMTLANQLWRVGPCYQNGINGLKKWGSDMKTTYFIALSGLRGGVGTTSMVALLEDALWAHGEAVLVVDLNPADVLRLHFNIPYEEKRLGPKPFNSPWVARAVLSKGAIATGATLWLSRFK